MTRYTACRVALLFFLGFLSFGTSPIIGRPQTLAGPPEEALSASANEEELKPGAIVLRKSEVRKGRGEDLDEDHVLGPLLGPEMACFSLYRMSAESKGRDVIVSAKADVQDKREGVAYVWVIAVKDRATKKKVRQIVYKNRLFWLEDKKFAQPTFQEMLELDPGSYSVALSLHEVPKGFDFSNPLPKGSVATSRTCQVSVVAPD